MSLTVKADLNGAKLLPLGGSGSSTVPIFIPSSLTIAPTGAEPLPYCRSGCGAAW